MSNRLAKRQNPNARKLGVLMAGGVVGALAGIGAAYLLLQAREARQRETDTELPILSSNSAVKLGLLLFGLFRQIQEIARGR